MPEMSPTVDRYEALEYQWSYTVYRCRKCGEVFDFSETEGLLDPDQVHACKED